MPDFTALPSHELSAVPETLPAFRLAKLATVTDDRTGVLANAHDNAPKMN